MKIAFVRNIRQEEVPQFADWACKTPNNAIDPGILAYKSTTCLCAFGDSGPIAYMPVQRPLHMESLVLNPAASETEITRAVHALLQTVVCTAEAEGRGEIYFMATEGTIPKMSADHHFEELPYRVFRLKTKDLEPCQQ